MSEWYCTLGGAIRGPFTYAELEQLVADGKLLPDDQVLFGKSGTWAAADAARFNLFPVAEQEPGPSPPQTPPRPTRAVRARRSRYAAIERLAEWYQFLAFVNGIAAAVVAVLGVLMVERNAGAGLAVLAGAIIGGFFGVITMLATSQILVLVLDVEETLRQIRNRLPKSDDDSPTA